MTNQPSVSIVIIAMNDESYIGYAVESALKQDYPNKEIHVQIGAASRDRTVDIVKGYGVSYAIEPDTGVPDGANKGIEKTTGELVVFIGGDDALLPGAVTRLVEEWARHPGAAMIYGEVQIIDATGRPYAFPRSGEFDLGRMFKINYIPAQAVMVTRHALLEVGMWRTSIMNADWDLWIRIGARHPAVYVPARLAEYRVHTGSASLNNLERCGWSTREMADDLLEDPAVRSRLGAEADRARAAAYMVAATWFFRAGRFAAAWKTVRDAVRSSPSVLLTRKAFALIFGVLIGPRLYEKFCARGAGIESGSAGTTA
jgi:glycosyltransferase involved in cell wall biosynthesis